MKNRTLMLALACAGGVATVSAQVKPDDHAAHHPPGGAGPAAQAPAAPAASAAAAGADRFAEQMGKMQDMHRRMQAAKTPAERQALMGEHMKLMQSGMEMMSQMGMGASGAQGMGGMGMMGAQPGASAASAATGGQQGMGGMMGMHGAMDKRMAMMEMMMQMMVDREAAMPRK